MPVADPETVGAERQQDKGRKQGDSARTDEQRFVLQVVQPGLAGLMDGSVSTLAPLFATAFATHRTLTTFLVGFAAAVGAGISMAFSEALSDTGELTGRGSPWMRGSITGLMTFVGGVGHTLPFLLGNYRLALTVAFFVVGLELIAIAYVRYRYFSMNFFTSVLQVIVGGLLVFGSGVLIGSQG
jgi:VIT1/CCC1 family predicted Fe2+/Mn2+ transporter